MLERERLNDGFPDWLSAVHLAPCAIAAWLGTRVRSPMIAFAVAWVLTPLVSYVITVLGTPVLRAITPAGNDGTGAIMIPFLGIVTGDCRIVAATSPT
jgi:hypothetical protein